MFPPSRYHLARRAFLSLCSPFPHITEVCRIVCSGHREWFQNSMLHMHSQCWNLSWNRIKPCASWTGKNAHKCFGKELKITPFYVRDSAKWWKESLEQLQEDLVLVTLELRVSERCFPHDEMTRRRVLGRTFPSLQLHDSGTVGP